MNRWIKWIGIPALAFALIAVGDAQQASAGDGFRLQIGGFGINSYSGHHGYRSYRAPSYGHGFHSGYRGGFYGTHSSRYGGHSSYRIRPHYDYHRPAIVPHRGHYHYRPGHYGPHYGGHRGYRGHYRH